MADRTHSDDNAGEDSGPVGVSDRPASLRGFERKLAEARRKREEAQKAAATTETAPKTDDLVAGLRSETAARPAPTDTEPAPPPAEPKRAIPANPFAGAAAKTTPDATVDPAQPDRPQPQEPTSEEADAKPPRRRRTVLPTESRSKKSIEPVVVAKTVTALVMLGVVGVIGLAVARGFDAEETQVARSVTDPQLLSAPTATNTAPLVRSDLTAPVAPSFAAPSDLQGPLPAARDGTAVADLMGSATFGASEAAVASATDNDTTRSAPTSIPDGPDLRWTALTPPGRIALPASASVPAEPQMPQAAPAPFRPNLPFAVAPSAPASSGLIPATDGLRLNAAFAAPARIDRPDALFEPSAPTAPARPAPASRPTLLSAIGQPDALAPRRDVFQGSRPGGASDPAILRVSQGTAPSPPRLPGPSAVDPTRLASPPTPVRVLATSSDFTAPVNDPDSQAGPIRSVTPSFESRRQSPRGPVLLRIATRADCPLRSGCARGGPLPSVEIAQPYPPAPPVPGSVDTAPKIVGGAEARRLGVDRGPPIFEPLPGKPSRRSFAPTQPIAIILTMPTAGFAQ